jgi:hypothetical protein
MYYYFSRYYFIQVSKLLISFGHVMSDIPTHPITPVPPPQQRPPRIPPQTTDGDTMERLFQALFYRLAIIYARAIPKHIRRLGESSILIMVFILEFLSQRKHFIEIIFF